MFKTSAKTAPARWIAIGMLLLLACTLSSCKQGMLHSTVPTDRLDQPWWAQRHREVLELIRQHPDAPLLLIGDSITQNYEKAAPPDEDFQSTWQQFYGARGALNLGFSGDGTEHLLWRLQHGEVDGLQPKLAVVLIGTNDTGWLGHSARRTQLGIDAVVAELQRRLPRTHILLLGLLPSDVSAEKSLRDSQVNRYLARRYAESSHVTYLDVGAIFLRRGRLDVSRFYDTRFSPPAAALHPDTVGQRMLAEAIEPTLARLLDQPPVRPLAELGTEFNTALIPVARLEPDLYDWYQRHQQVLITGRRLRPEIVMIGDSITHFWAGLPAATVVNGAASWHWLYGDRKVLNLGFGWDRTQNVLWRIRQGELDGLAPKSVVINIGTNNLTGTANARANTPAEVADGVSRIVDEVRRILPESRVIVMAILPRGHAADDVLREPINKVNGLLAARFAADPAVQWIDVGSQYLAPDGSLLQTLMPDGTHPSDAGYRIWAEALRAAGV